MLNMMNFLKDFQSIFLKPNIPKKMAFQKDNLNRVVRRLNTQHRRAQHGLHRKPNVSLYRRSVL
jgi:hypothetical protein